MSSFTQQYPELRKTSIALSSFPFALNEQSSDFYNTSIKSCILVGVMVFIMFTILLLRFWIIMRYGEPFRLWTVKTFSCFTICVSAILGVAYLWLLLGYSMAFIDWEKNMKKAGKYPVEGIRKMDPGDALLGIPVSIGKTRVAARYVLLALLWFVKIGFISIFFEFRKTLKKTHKVILYAISIISITCIVIATIYTIVQSALVREKATGTAKIERQFTIHTNDPLVLAIPEYILAGMDLFVDVLLIIVTAIILHSLKLSHGERSRALLLVSPGLITVGIALIRCILLLIGSLRKTDQHEGCTWALSFLTPIGTFLSLYVVSIPAMRLLMRRWKGKGQWKTSTPEDITPINTTASYDRNNYNGNMNRNSNNTDLEKSSSFRSTIQKSRMGSIWSNKGNSTDLEKASSLRETLQKSRMGSIWSRYRYSGRNDDSEYEGLTWKCSEKLEGGMYRNNTRSTTTSMMTMDSEATTSHTIVSEAVDAEIERVLPNLDMGDFFVGMEADRKFEEVIKKERENYAKLRGI